MGVVEEASAVSAVVMLKKKMARAERTCDEVAARDTSSETRTT